MFCESKYLNQKSILSKDRVKKYILPYLSQGKRGRNLTEDKRVSIVLSIFHRLKTGCQWRELPKNISKNIIVMNLSFITLINGVKMVLGKECGHVYWINIKLSRIVDYLYVKAGSPYESLFQLTNGMIINQITEKVSILVNPVCSSIPIESFEMSIQGPELNWSILHNAAPYGLFDNFGLEGKYFNPGSYTLTVTGYAQDNKGGGITYGPKIITFVVVGYLATINTPSPSKTTICAGNSIDITFAATGSFNNTNQFHAELSDASDSFERPILIGTTNSIGTINGIIPPNTVEGANYRIRVISSNQVVVSNPAVSPITVYPLTHSLISPNNNLTGINIKKAVNTINARNKITSPANITYQAGKAIVLTSGFESNAVFKAEIKACDN